jgi:four helix bundle protein
MSRIDRFQDLIAWQKARVLTGKVYLSTRGPIFAKDFGLTNQIQRAAVSIMSNIAEGFERDGRSEFYHFLTIARASCAEVKSHLYVALDNGYICSADCESILLLANEVSRIISALRMAVKNQRDEKPHR